MIISLIGHERNLGILTLTDHLINKLGKSNCVVMGWNYLIEDPTSFYEKVDASSKLNKSIIIKYIVPRNRFSSNQIISYPDFLKDRSDVVFRVPTYREEVSAKVPKIFFKGEDNPIVKHVNEFYSPAK